MGHEVQNGEFGGYPHEKEKRDISLPPFSLIQKKAVCGMQGGKLCNNNRTTVYVFLSCFLYKKHRLLFL